METAGQKKCIVATSECCSAVQCSAVQCSAVPAARAPARGSSCSSGRACRGRWRTLCGPGCGAATARSRGSATFRQLSTRQLNCVIKKKSLRLMTIGSLTAAPRRQTAKSQHWVLMSSAAQPHNWRLEAGGGGNFANEQVDLATMLHASIPAPQRLK